MISATELSSAIHHELQALRRPTTDSIRAARCRHSRALAASPPTLILGVARQLIKLGGWPERLVAYELIGARTDAIHLLDADAVDRLGHGLADWGSIDLFGVTVAGVAWRGAKAPSTPDMFLLGPARATGGSGD